MSMRHHRGRGRRLRPTFEFVVLFATLAVVISQSFGVVAASAKGSGSFSAWGWQSGSGLSTTGGTTGGGTSDAASPVLAKPTTETSTTQLAPLASSSLSVNLDQYANGGNTQGASWVNGDLNQHNAAYHEGDVVPFRLALEGLSAGTHTIHINYDFTAGGHEAYDFLATWNDTESPGLCDSGGGAVSSMCPGLGSADTKAFPSDSFAPGFPTDSGLTVAGAEAFSGVSRNLSMYGGTITSITGPTHSGPAGGNSSGDFTVTFDASGSAVLFAWGGHLAESAYWVTTTGQPNGAVTISGAPWHMRTQQLDGDGNKNQDRSIQPSAIVPLPGLTIAKTADSSSVPAGDPIGFTITVTNTGNVGLTDVSLIDPLPGGNGADWSSDPPTGDTANLSCAILGSPPNEVLSCQKSSLAAGNSFSVHVTSPTSNASCLTYNNTATVSADGVPDASSSDSVTLTGCAPNLTITKQAQNADGQPITSVPLGGTFNYIITVTNTGNASASPVIVTDDLNDSLTINSTSWDVNPPDAGTDGTCSVGVGNTVSCPSTGTITLSASDGAPDGSDTLRVIINVTVPQGLGSCPTLTNSAQVRIGDGTPSSAQSAPVDVTGCAPNLTITKSGPATVANGGTITYTVTLHDPGNAAAGSVIVTDNLDDSLHNVTATSDQGTCSVGPNPANQSDQNFVTCNVGTVDAGRSVTITIKGTTLAGVCPSIANQASFVTSGGEGPGGTSNIVTTTVTGCVPPSPPGIGIQLVKGGPSLAHVGDTITYTFAVSLTTATPLGNITLTDPICSAAPTLVSKTGGNQDAILQSGETWNYTCTHLVTATDPDPLPNTATVTGTASDGRQTSAQASHTVDIIHPAIRIVKTASPTSVAPEGTVTYTYKVTNTGDVILTDVKVTDDKLGDVCTIGTLDVGQTKTCTKNFVTPANLAAPIDNVGTATGRDPTGVDVEDMDTATVGVVLATTVTPPGGLAFTGASRVFQLAGLGLLLLLIGSGILYMTRRQKQAGGSIS